MFQVAFIEEEEEQISVEAGDILGIHYNVSMSGDRVISYEDSRKGSTNGIGLSDLSAVIVEWGLSEDDVAVGGEYHLPRLFGQTRLPALSAFVEY